MAAKDSTLTHYLCAHCARVLPLAAFPLVRPGKPRRPTRKHRCLDCTKEYKRQYYLAHNGAHRQRFKPADPIKNAEKRRIGWTQYRKENLDHVRATEAAYRARKRSECNARIRAWKTANPHLASKHRFAKLRAIPAWADHVRIAAIYAQAKKLTAQTGEAWHVDHIVPLNSPLVCGLHCEANLRAVHWLENVSKKNRHWPDMP